MVVKLSRIVVTGVLLSVLACGGRVDVDAEAPGTAAAALSYGVSLGRIRTDITNGFDLEFGPTICYPNSKVTVISRTSALNYLTAANFDSGVDSEITYARSLLSSSSAAKAVFISGLKPGGGNVLYVPYTSAGHLGRSGFMFDLGLLAGYTKDENCISVSEESGYDNYGQDCRCQATGCVECDDTSTCTGSTCGGCPIASPPRSGCSNQTPFGDATTFDSTPVGTQL